MISKGARLKTYEQVSAGGIVYRNTNAGIEIVLILTASEHRWQLPKGIIDPGETEVEAGQREVREETGISAEPVEKIGTTEYWFTVHQDGTRRRYHKQVHWFLMKYVSGDVDGHDHEVAEARWFDAATALEKLVFKNEREMVEAAVDMVGLSN